VADALARNISNGNKPTIDRLLSDSTGGELTRNDFDVLNDYVNSEGQATELL
jgi:hypothetical protein